MNCQPKKELGQSPQLNCNLQVEVAGVADRHRRVGDQPELGGDATQGPAEAETGKSSWPRAGFDQAWWQGAGLDQARRAGGVGKAGQVASVRTESQTGNHSDRGPWRSEDGRCWETKKARRRKKEQPKRKRSWWEAEEESEEQKPGAAGARGVEAGLALCTRSRGDESKEPVDWDWGDCSEESGACAGRHFPLRRELEEADKDERGEAGKSRGLFCDRSRQPSLGCA